MDMDEIEESHPVLQASILYADLLNHSSMSNHIVKLIGKTNTKNMTVVPYVYFATKHFDVERKVRKNLFTEDLDEISYPIKEIDLDNDDHISQYAVTTYKKYLPKSGNCCGLIGVPIPSEEDPDAVQDHYVSYVYESETETLNYFDSALDKDWKTTETYKILSQSFEPKKVVKNSKTFEEAGGASEDPFNYIAQNIFCHTWSLWFLYQFIFEKKSMTQINTYASKAKGDGKHKANLIRIKKFINEIIIMRLGLDELYNYTLFESFRYIIINSDPKKTLEIISSE